MERLKRDHARQLVAGVLVVAALVVLTIGYANIRDEIQVAAQMPYVLTGMRIAMGNSFAAVVGAEFIAAQTGLGFLIIDSGTWMATDRMFAGMLTLGLLGIVADQCFRAVTSRAAARYLMPA